MEANAKSLWRRVHVCVHVFMCVCVCLDVSFACLGLGAGCSGVDRLCRIHAVKTQEAGSEWGRGGVKGHHRSKQVTGVVSHLPCLDSRGRPLTGAAEQSPAQNGEGRRPPAHVETCPQLEPAHKPWVRPRPGSGSPQAPTRLSGELTSPPRRRGCWSPGPPGTRTRSRRSCSTDLRGKQTNTF